MGVEIVEIGDDAHDDEKGGYKCGGVLYRT